MHKVISATKTITLQDEAGWRDLFGARRQVMNAYVFRCIQIRAGALSSVPIVFADSATPVEQITAELLYNIEASLLFAGAAYVSKPTRKTGWRVINPLTMKVIASEKGISHFEQTVRGTVARIDPASLVYIRYWNPYDDLGPGLAPFEIARLAGETIDKAESFTRAFFDNGAVPPLIFSPETGEIREEDRKQIADVFRRTVAGIQNAWRALVLRRGINIRELSMPSLANLAMEKVNEIARARIAVAFGVPQTMIEDAANFATAREHRLSFWRETIIPDCEMIEDALNNQYFAALGKPVRFAIERIEALQKEESEKADAVLKLYTAGIISRDEARAIMDIEPASDKREEPSAVEEMRRWRDKSRKRGKLAAFRSAVIPESWAAVVEERECKGLDPFGHMRYLKSAPNLDADAERLRGVIEKVFSGWASWLAKEIAGGNTSPDVSEIENELRAKLQIELTNIAVDAASAVADATVNWYDFDLVYNAAQEWAQSYTFEMVRGINETTQNVIRRAVTTYMQTEGMTTGQLAELLSKAFGESRANMIAVTEVTRAYAQGVDIAREAYAGYGITLTEVWRTSADETTCEICSPLDGLERGNGWDELPPAHPNCRCWITLEKR